MFSEYAFYIKYLLDNNFFTEYVQLLADKYGFTLALSNNQTKGYHIIMSLSKNQRSLNKSDLPPEFIQVQKNLPFLKISDFKIVINILSIELTPMFHIFRYNDSWTNLLQKLLN